MQCDMHGTHAHAHMMHTHAHVIQCDTYMTRVTHVHM